MVVITTHKQLYAPKHAHILFAAELNWTFSYKINNLLFLLSLTTGFNTQ